MRCAGSCPPALRLKDDIAARSEVVLSEQLDLEVALEVAVDVSVDHVRSFAVPATSTPVAITDEAGARFVGPDAVRRQDNRGDDQHRDGDDARRTPCPMRRSRVGAEIALVPFVLDRAGRIEQEQIGRDRRAQDADPR
jgi:hypothetical protein